MVYEICMKVRIIFTTLFLMLMLVVSAYASEDTKQLNTNSNSYQERLAPIQHPPMVKAGHGISSVKGPKNIINDYSYNWAGYAISGGVGSITSVEGSWEVPTATQSIPGQRTYSAHWLGIDGFSSSSVEQIGTSSDTDAYGIPSYYVWYEFYPSPAYMFTNFPIKPGDVIYAKVTYTPAVSKNPKKPANGGTYILTLTVNGETVTKTSTTVKADRSSAEWVSEAPSRGGVLPLANFGTCDYGFDNTHVANTCTYTMNGVPSTIGCTANTDAVHKIDMTSESSSSDNIITKASTSTISTSGTSFDVTCVSAI